MVERGRAPINTSESKGAKSSLAATTYSLSRHQSQLSSDRRPLWHRAPPPVESQASLLLLPFADLNQLHPRVPSLEPPLLASPLRPRVKTMSFVQDPRRPYQRPDHPWACHALVYQRASQSPTSAEYRRRRPLDLRLPAVPAAQLHTRLNSMGRKPTSTKQTSPRWTVTGTAERKTDILLAMRRTTPSAEPTAAGPSSREKKQRS